MSFDLMLISDDAIGDALVDRTREALRRAPPGRVALQLRAKNLPDRDFLSLARVMRPLTREREVFLLINARADIARLVDADGVHLPASGVRVEEARSLLAKGTLVGVSCHDREELRVAQMAGADYALLSPFAVSPGKGAALGDARFAELRKGISMRVLALGGIDATNASVALAAGADGLALIRAVYAAKSPTDALLEMLSILDTRATLAR